MRDDLSANYRLMADIDLSGYSNWTPIGDYASSTSNIFSGTLDGNGRTIQNLTISSSSNYQGFFGYIESGAKVSPLTLTRVNVEGTDYVGELAGWNWGTITDCYATGAVEGSADVCGFVGYLTADTIMDCYYDSETTGRTNSYATGKTTAEMYEKATFSGWDFDPVWGIDEGESYPYLLWERK